jgi:hypothetical protein
MPVNTAAVLAGTRATPRAQNKKAMTVTTTPQ